MQRLDLTFSALSDPTRRAILSRLATGEAAVDEGFGAVLIEREPAYCADIRWRLGLFLTPAPVAGQPIYNRK